MPDHDHDHDSKALEIAESTIRAQRRIIMLLLVGLLAFVVMATGVGVGVDIPGLGELHLDAHEVRATVADTGPALEAPEAPPEEPP